MKRAIEWTYIFCRKFRVRVRVRVKRCTHLGDWVI